MHTVYQLKNGTQVPSTTTIISQNLGWNKDHLIKWYKNIALERGQDASFITEEAADIGSITHELIEYKIKKQVPDITNYNRDYLKLAKNGYLAFCDWESQYKPDNYLFSEVVMVSEKYCFGGTADIIIEKNNEPHLIDIKTCNWLHPEMVIQLAAYKHLLKETRDIDIKTCTIIKVNKKEPLFETKSPTEEQLKNGWEIFKRLLYINNTRKQLEEFSDFD